MILDPVPEEPGFALFVQTSRNARLSAAAFPLRGNRCRAHDTEFRAAE